MPQVRQLPNKPLVEAMLEIRWELPSAEGDPHYPVLVGALYEHVKADYPEHEPLPTALIPPPGVEYVVQHRFRAGKGHWPLVQVGPGIVTLNDTENYTWSDFGGRARALVQTLYNTYPSPSKLHIIDVLLRYIDAVELGSEQDDVFAFLKHKLKTQIVLPEQLFQGVPIEREPLGFHFQAAYPIKDPKGSILIRFGTGKHKGKNALFWETAVRSRGSDVPVMPDMFSEWIVKAHNITDDWFFKLIEGELERIFLGEE